MSLTEKFEKIFKSLLPAPFTIAVLLTFLTFLLAFFFTETEEKNHLLEIFSFWEQGVWNPKLLVFTVQMMLMLVLGHVLALSDSVNSIVSYAVKRCDSTPKAAAIVTFFTILVSLFNWGLGLIFGAIFAKKVAEHASINNIKINYPLIGACGYSGLMVWHGGISGSAPIKVAESGHFLADQIGIISQSETIFSTMNISVSILLLIVLPVLMYIIGKKENEEKIVSIYEIKQEKEISIVGAEKLDNSKFIAWIFGGSILFYAFYKAIILPENITLKVITPNYINLLLLAIGIIMHKTFINFLRAVDNAIVGSSGILIQFPLYFGIMGIINQSGLTLLMSNFFINISNEITFPIFTFLSAGIVNIFVPSGGGQWAIQGPIIVEAATQLGVSIPKSIMALAYGDQLTNMLQPFWALPLLGITGLKAKDILPYTLILFIVGFSIFIFGLLFF